MNSNAVSREMTVTWRAALPGDRYAIVACAEDGSLLPYSVARVVIAGVSRFEAWRRFPAARGGFWGGALLGWFADAQAARRRCVDDLNAAEVAIT